MKQFKVNLYKLTDMLLSFLFCVEISDHLWNEHVSRQTMNHPLQKTEVDLVEINEVPRNKFPSARNVLGRR